MQLEFDPEKEFERLTGKSITLQEKEKFKDFVAKYFLRNQNYDLKDFIEGVLDVNRQVEFRQNDFGELVKAYEGKANSSISVPKNVSNEVISKVRKACDKAVNGDSDDIKKIIKESGFRDIYDDLLVKRGSDNYNFLFLNGFNGRFKKIKTGYVSLPPSKGEELERKVYRLTNLEESRFDFGQEGEGISGPEIIFAETLILDVIVGLVYGFGAGLAGVASAKGLGITEAISTAVPTVANLSYLSGKAIVAEMHKKSIERCFSKSKYPHICSTEQYSPGVILNAIASNEKDND